MNNISKNRIKREIEMLSCSPPAGIFCSTAEDRLDLLHAQILGQEGTPFEGGVFHLEIQVPDRYPFDPPSVKFVTPIYHPNIDTNGRICLDTLKLPPKGTWRPCLNISTVLMMIRVLMVEPGAEDPLMTAIWQEYKYDYTAYVEKAKKWTQLHAVDSLLKKAPGKSTSEDKGQHSASSVSNFESSSDQDSELVSKKVSDPAPSMSNTDCAQTSGKSVVRSKKLGLANKRKALVDRDANCKDAKIS
ncbi:hypothetical protein EGW08_002343 [Elysia chlorotica]|uniref:Ubiquitin-conjugating enzyme E2 T n=1 Tax=Elysia chlorotica TaxID=188477 RepID=A0A3S1BRP2_ELYCH|nr:hypothetical protein EGW08_002343 [Elysia chlorotica]